MRRRARFFGLCFSGFALVVACGARTGLGVNLPPEVDASVDHSADIAPDNSFTDTPQLHDGHPLDVMPDCATPTYCDPANPGYVYKCGVQIYQCGSLEQCLEPCGEAGAADACAAECVNPCLNTLGQNTSNGCEFYAVEMDTTQEVAGVCYAVFIVNEWQTGQPARLEVDMGGKVLPIETFARIPSGTGADITYAPFSATAGLPQNQVAILFLSRDPEAVNDPNPDDPRLLANCPPGVMTAYMGDAALHGTGLGTNTFHIKSNVPVVAYQMLPYGGGHARVTAATLLLPTNVWGTNYMAVNAYEAPTSIVESSGSIPGPTMAIIAQQDNTHVTINPVAAISSGGSLGGTPARTPITYTVDKGQYLQFTQKAELTGSPIQSDNPIAVIGGATLMDLPLSDSRADTAEQMLPPISALGSEYVAVRYRSRDPGSQEIAPWRLVGVVDGTTLTYDPAPPPGAPMTLRQGQVVEIDDPGPWVVSSQDKNHPFYFAQYMTGGTFLSGPNFSSSLLYGQGDPEFVNVITPAEYLPGYTFFTDPTYPETNLVVVAELDGATNQFPTVKLDCAGTLTGWQPLGTAGKYQFTRVDLSTGNFQGQNGCNNGVHTIAATLSGAPVGDTAAIGVTVWGWGSQATAPDTSAQDPNFTADEASPNFTCWVSYGYPAGANIAKLNSVVVPAN